MISRRAMKGNAGVGDACEYGDDAGGDNGDEDDGDAG